MAEAEHAYVTALLEETHGNVKQAAHIAGLNRTYCYRLFERNGYAPKRAVRSMHPAWRALTQVER